MNISLTQQEGSIRQQVESGRADDAGDVVREVWDLIEARDAKVRLRTEVGRGFEQIERGKEIASAPAMMERLKRDPPTTRG